MLSPSHTVHMQYIKQKGKAQNHWSSWHVFKSTDVILLGVRWIFFLENTTNYDFFPQITVHILLSRFYGQEGLTKCMICMLMKMIENGRHLRKGEIPTSSGSQTTTAWTLQLSQVRPQINNLELHHVEHLHCPILGGYVPLERDLHKVWHFQGKGHLNQQCLEQRSDIFWIGTVQYHWRGFFIGLGLMVLRLVTS